MIQRLGVVGSNPTVGNFLTKFILFCVTLDLSDNLTEMCIVKTSMGQILVGDDVTVASV